jgi:hypothetical protein
MQRAVRIGITVATFAALVAVASAVWGSSGCDFRSWGCRIVADPAQPEWKRVLLAYALLRENVSHLAFRSTWYSDDDQLDPGGAGCRVKWHSLPVRWGYLAADWKHWKPGTVFYSPVFRRLFVVVDAGPGVEGRDRVDLYIPDAATLRKYRARVQDGRITLIPLGIIGWREAR